MDNPQLLWPCVASVPVLAGLLWWLAPRLWNWWTRNRPPNLARPTSTHDALGSNTPVFDGGNPHMARGGSFQCDGSPSPPSSPVTGPRGTIGVGSLTLTPTHPRRLSLRSAALNPGR